MYLRKADNMDILLVCEGTFPYVKGGVSSWIYQLIKGLPEFTFGIVFLGGRREEYKEPLYDLPENLVHLETHFLFDSLFDKNKKNEIKGVKNLVPMMRGLHEWFMSKGDLSEELKRLDFYKKIDHKQFLYSKRSFDFITERYQENCPGVPFLEYFWTVRNIHSPIWILAELALKIPLFKMIHSPSTGYAGFLSSLLKNNYGGEYILTEHGIYLMERKIDIMISDWIQEYRINMLKSSNEENYIKNLWIRLFQGMNKFAYESADSIVSLYGGARKIQISYGAAEKKTRIIPNGINISALAPLRNLRPKETPKVVSLIGRVVPIKDVKTFITAIKIASKEIKDIEGWIVGPREEDPEYSRECEHLVKTLSLEKNIKFTGFKKISEILPETGVLTLTSISEGMPLVILEGFAAGIPAVATNVGACSELIYGRNEEDLRLGKAGEITPVSNPRQLARAYCELLSDRGKWNSYQKSAITRVEKYYDEEKLFEEYRKIYGKGIEKALKKSGKEKTS